jgi:hypothetical protein
LDPPLQEATNNLEEATRLRDLLEMQSACRASILPGICLKTRYKRKIQEESGGPRSDHPLVGVAKLSGDSAPRVEKWSSTW